VKKTMVLFILLIAALVITGSSPTIVSASEAKATESSSTQQSATTKININNATATELEKLPGIGPKMAVQILDFREANGPFKSVEDLKQIKGVGPKKFEQIKSVVTVE